MTLAQTAILIVGCAVLLGVFYLIFWLGMPRPPKDRG